jgi:hypothetical protein
MKKIKNPFFVRQNYVPRDKNKCAKRVMLEVPLVSLCHSRNDVAFKITIELMIDHY